MVNPGMLKVHDDRGPHNAAFQLQAVVQKAGDSSPSDLYFKESNCDDFLETRA
jgi:hypothetical protein